MSKQFLLDSFGWGALLWLAGYVLGIILFMIVSPATVGWVIMPVGTLITLWVLFKKIKADSLKHYWKLAFVWTTTAILFDYFFLVKLFNPADGYYKLDVYIYYFLIFALPVIVGMMKHKKR